MGQDAPRGTAPCHGRKRDSGAPSLVRASHQLLPPPRHPQHYPPSAARCAPAGWDRCHPPRGHALVLSGSEDHDWDLALGLRLITGVVGVLRRD